MSLSIDFLFLLIVSFYWMSLSIDCLFLLIVSLSISNLLCIDKVKHSSTLESGSELQYSPMANCMLPARELANQISWNLPSNWIRLAMFQESTTLSSKRCSWISDQCDSYCHNRLKTLVKRFWCMDPKNMQVTLMILYVISI